MKALSALFLSVMLLAGQQVAAHSDHDHRVISEAAAIELGSKVAKKLSSTDVGLEIGQLSESWASVMNDKFKIHKKGNGYFIVSALNESEKKTLYILMSTGGEVYDANFSGAFEGIK